MSLISDSTEKTVASKVNIANTQLRPLSSKPRDVLRYIRIPASKSRLLQHKLRLSHHF